MSKRRNLWAARWRREGSFPGPTNLERFAFEAKWEVPCICGPQPLRILADKVTGTLNLDWGPQKKSAVGSLCRSDYSLASSLLPPLSLSLSLSFPVPFQNEFSHVKPG